MCTHWLLPLAKRMTTSGMSLLQTFHQQTGATTAEGPA